MRYGIISDIHSNLQALEKVLQLFECADIDEIICLGDIVGYNANPGECVDLIQNHPKIKHIVRGNHDFECTELDSMSRSQILNISQSAYTGLLWSSKCLAEHQKQWLRSLPTELLIKDEYMPFWIGHCSPDMCTDFGYILSEWDAQWCAKVLKKRKSSKVYLFGHSHAPTFYCEKSKVRNEFALVDNEIGEYKKLDLRHCYFLNPGSVGQPRGHTLNSYAILDTQTKEFLYSSFVYDIDKACSAIYKAGYCDNMADRLYSRS